MGRAKRNYKIDKAKNITKLINVNFQTTMTELEDDIKELKNKKNDCQKSLQFIENELKEKIESVEKKHESL